MPKEKQSMKECKTHGLTTFILENRGYYRCKTCRVGTVSKWRRNRKKKLVEHFGGKCVKCGYNKYIGALDFHHIDPKTKSFGIAAGGMTQSYERALGEAKKCILVCKNCHCEIEQEERIK